jgi:hypothetical protein
VFNVPPRIVAPGQELVGIEPITFTTLTNPWRCYEIAAYNVSINSSRSCLDATVENVDNLMNLECPVTPAVRLPPFGL